jgi:hypothetical protein
MVVHEFNISGPLAGPDETQAELVVHSDGVLTPSIPLQSLQAIARREPQVVQPLSRVEHRELALHDPFEIGRKALSGSPSLKERRAARILESYDRHAGHSPEAFVSRHDTKGNLNG